MTTTSANSVQITNQLNIAITVYDTTSTDAPTNPPSTNSADYYPVYTKIATVAANSTQTVPVSETLARLVLTRADNDFPICVYVPPITGGGSVQIANQDLTPC